MKKLLSGNEALARGALEARIEIACGYPGTPSSEILENVSKYKEIYSEWSVNEKVAMDAAAGAAYSGRRALVTTKQVGMNVMSDSLFYTAYTGAEAALVVVTADDPGLFSSQNEQDNRHYAKLGKFPMLEPCDSQECKDFMGEAVAISERFDTPGGHPHDHAHLTFQVRGGARRPRLLRARGRPLSPQHREVQLHVHVGAQAALHP